jgi:hypothetical protein
MKNIFVMVILIFILLSCRAELNKVESQYPGELTIIADCGYLGYVYSLKYKGNEYIIVYKSSIIQVNK